MDLFRGNKRWECIDKPKEILEILSQCLRLPNSFDLARLIILCRSDRQLTGELARFVVDVTASRKREFAKLIVRDMFPESIWLSVF